MVFGGVQDRSFLNTESAFSAPVSQPTVVVTILNVEPGMYRSWYAFASNGLRGSLFSSFR